MHRDKFTEKLTRILSFVDSDSLPARIQKVYVFGSYARGALEPGDLDLIVIHERAKPEYLAAAKRHFEEQDFGDLEASVRAQRKFRNELARSFRKPGERVQVLLSTDLSDFVHPGSRIKDSDLVLLWSESDRNWREKVAGILPDPAAGRAPREHLISLTRLRDHVGTMEKVVQMIADGKLLLQRIPVESIDCQLSEENTRRLAWWGQGKVMGRESMKLLPYAMWWLEKYGEKLLVHVRTEIWSEARTHRLELGRPSLSWMINVFRTSPAVKRQCLIPHFKTKGPNELLDFTRGPRWRDDDEQLMFVD